jgi:hypothetical protein
LFEHQMRYHNQEWKACPHPDCEGRSTLYPLIRPHWSAVHDVLKCEHCGLKTERRRISKHNYVAHGEGGKPQAPRLCFASLQFARDSALDSPVHDSAIAKRWETKTTQEEDEELEGDEEHEEDQQFEEDILTMQDCRPFDSLWFPERICLTFAFPLESWQQFCIVVMPKKLRQHHGCGCCPRSQASTDWLAPCHGLKFVPSLHGTSVFTLP